MAFESLSFGRGSKEKSSFGGGTSTPEPEEATHESQDEIANAIAETVNDSPPIMQQERQKPSFQHIEKADFREITLPEAEPKAAKFDVMQEDIFAKAQPAAIEKTAPKANSTDEYGDDTYESKRNPFAEITAAEEEEAVNEANGISKKPMRIGDKLVALGLISKDQLDTALREQKSGNNKKLVGAILVGMGFITESALGEVLAESAGTEKFDPKQAVLDPDLIRTIPKEVALRQKVVPVGLEANKVILAMADVYNVIATDQVRRYFPKSVKIKPIFCSEGDILDLIEKYYDYETSVDGIIREIETGIADKTKLDGQEDNYQNPTVRLVNAFLVDAIHRGASDIHFEPEGTFLRLRYRIDGQLVQVLTLHKDYWMAIAVRVKIMSGMNIAETRMPQDGRINYNVAGRDVDFRVATQPTISGENIVLRLLDKKKALMPFDKLGFSEHNAKLLKRLLKRPEGIIIVTGPTGSGKTTTLYSVLEYINSIEVNIMTLEDPVEYQLSLIRQSNVKEGAGMGFAGGMKSLMRQDPDIIFIGEIRDEVTANMAVKAAMTGHKVFSTLHTNDALGIIPRLFDIGVSPETLSGAMICGIAQRLARRLCKHCKEAYTATPEDCRILGVDIANPPTIYKAVGCPECGNKGYKGRIALHEIMPIDKEMDELIATHSTRKQMNEYLSSNGYVQMLDDGAAKCLEGHIDVKEIMRSVDVTERID
jgi:general secretion pathway protein E/type IV pilus assembly protein PilB